MVSTLSKDSDEKPGVQGGEGSRGRQSCQKEETLKGFKINKPWEGAKEKVRVDPANSSKARQQHPNPEVRVLGAPLRLPHHQFGCRAKTDDALLVQVVKTVMKHRRCTLQQSGRGVRPGNGSSASIPANPLTVATEFLPPSWMPFLMTSAEMNPREMSIFSKSCLFKHLWGERGLWRKKKAI